MFEGVYVALVTPFRDGRVDPDALGELVDFHVARGTTGIVPCGTTGESATLNHEEHLEVIRLVVERAQSRVQVIAGTGSNSTDEAIGLTRSAKEMGADGALVITPYYNKPTQRGLVCHFKAIADAVPEIPVILYNVPGRTGVDMLPETVEELCDIPSVVAIKEATGSLERASEIVVRCGDRITLLSGDDGLTLPLLSVGAKGVISVLANLDPGDLLGLVSAFREGNLEEARRLHCRVHRLSKAMFLESNPIPVKTALKLMGRLNGELRLPLCPMDPALEVTLSESLVAAGLLNEPIIGTGSRQEVTT